MKRRNFILLGIALLACPPAGRTQQSEKILRIGFLANDPTIPAQAAGAAFLEGLRGHGFAEGKNIVIERRFAQGAPEQSHELVTELTGLDVSVIVASGQNNIAALKGAPKSIPVVMVNAFDPIGMGIADSLASPGGNFTGLTSPISLRMLGKRLQLLSDAFPRISRLAVLRTPNFATDEIQWSWLERAAPAFNVRLIAVSVDGHSDLEAAFAVLRRERPDALFCLNNPLTLISRKEIAEFAVGERLRGAYPFAEVAEAGGLMSYGGSRIDLFRRAASYVANILNGAKPGGMPIEQPSKFELVINLKTANAIGVKVPRALIALAEKVIE
jgi:putative tryptophan/tyrosine transport system substrate-binding protein